MVIRNHMSCVQCSRLQLIYFNLIIIRFGFVEFETPEAAQEAYDNMKDQEIEGRQVHLDFASELNNAPRGDFRQGQWRGGGGRGGGGRGGGRGFGGRGGKKHVLPKSTTIGFIT